MITIYPSVKYPRALGIGVSLVLVVALMTWTVPLTIGAGVGLSGWALGIVLALIVHAPLFPLAFWFARAYYRTLRYEIHPDEVIVYAGLITKSVKHVPFRTVTNLKVTRGPIERYFGLGSLAIQTAGMSGSTGAEEKLDGLDDVQAVYDQIAAELRRYRRALGPTQADDDESGNGAVTDETMLGAILDELRGLRADLQRD